MLAIYSGSSNRFLNFTIVIISYFGVVLSLLFVWVRTCDRKSVMGNLYRTICTAWKGYPDKMKIGVNFFLFLTACDAIPVNQKRKWMPDQIAHFHFAWIPSSCGKLGCNLEFVFSNFRVYKILSISWVCIVVVSCFHSLPLLKQKHDQLTQDEKWEKVWAIDYYGSKPLKLYTLIIWWLYSTKVQWIHGIARKKFDH